MKRPSALLALRALTVAMTLACGLAATPCQAVLANMALPPAAVAVKGPLKPLPRGVEELKFQDMFKLPVGPRGLEPSARLLALHGRQVRVVGYMASQEEAQIGGLILTPVPVSLGDEDESLSDDLPGNAIFVHLAKPHAGKVVPNFQGLIQLVGTLSVGAVEEADGHVSSVRLVLDEPISRLLTTPAKGSRPSHAQSVSAKVANRAKPAGDEHMASSLR